MDEILPAEVQVYGRSRTSTCDVSPVRLSVGADDPCLWLLHVTCRDQVGLLFKLSELLTSRGIDLLRADIATQDGKVDNCMILRAAKASDISEASAWCRELENTVLPASSSANIAEPLAKATARLAVNPDLLSVASFREMESSDRSKEHRYSLELKGINQASLLAYLSLVFFRSGFSIARAKISTSGGHICNSFELTASSEDAARILRSYLDIPMRSDTDPGLPWGGSENLRTVGPSASAIPTQVLREDCDETFFNEAFGSPMPTPKTVHFGNGDVYKGRLLTAEKGNSMREGFGTYTYREGHPEYTRYEGQWAKDQKNGFGVMLVCDGGAYVGQWCANVRQGLGVFFGTNKDKESQQGDRPTYRYEGEWMDDNPNGLGIEEIVSEEEYSVYAGRFENGSRQKCGVKMDFLKPGISGCSVLEGTSWRPLTSILEEEARNCVPVFAPGDSDMGADLPARPPEPKTYHFANHSKANKLPTLADVFAEDTPKDENRFTSTRGHARTHGDSLLGECETPTNQQVLSSMITPKSTRSRAKSLEDVNSRTPTTFNKMMFSGSRDRKSSEDSIRPTPKITDTLTPGASLQFECTPTPTAQKRALTPEWPPKHQSVPLARSCPVLWTGMELAVFIRCLGMPAEAVENVRTSAFKGVLHLLEMMADAEECVRLGFASPLHRLIVRRCLQRLLEADRMDNSARGRTLRDVMGDTVLNAYIFPLEELKLESKLSQGGFGTVYSGLLTPSAHRSGLVAGKPQRVAVKAMTGGHQTRLYELLKEARVMASLDHPNICKFIGICADTRPQGQRFIISELMAGSLFDLIHRPHRISTTDGSLSVSNVVSLSKGISAGIAYVHELNLIHADLKSPNVLIGISPDADTKEGRYVPRICDFGHAAVRAVPSPHSRLCTPQWAAPEALRYESLGPSADVYSFGMILWEMLACKIPHSDLSFGQVQACVGWGGLAPDMKSLTHLPQEVTRILMWCVNFLPADRPSAKQLRQRLLRLPKAVEREADEHTRDFFGRDGSCICGSWISKALRCCRFTAWLAPAKPISDATASEATNATESEAPASEDTDVAPAKPVKPVSETTDNPAAETSI